MCPFRGTEVKNGPPQQTSLSASPLLSHRGSVSEFSLVSHTLVYLMLSRTKEVCLVAHHINYGVSLRVLSHCL